MRGLILVALSMSVFSSALGAELLVPSEYETIQAAINAASGGDEVIVADGTYSGGGNRNIQFKGKAITVRSENGPEECIIDCENSGNGFYFRYGEGEDSVVEGFSITNGRGIGADSYGGGIHCSSSSPTIVNCVISGNSAGDGGGGIYCKNSSATITGCTISGNSATDYWSSGGGIYCVGDNEGVSPVIADCTITGNSASNGGGIGCYESSPEISGCTIGGNFASYSGGGIRYLYSNVNIFNCVISGNSSDGLGGGVNLERCDGSRVYNCIISGNASSHGGGIYFEGGSSRVSSCVISVNRAYFGAGAMAEYGSNATLINCTVADNVVRSGGMVGGIQVDGGAAKITNCIVWGNTFSGMFPFQIYLDGGASGEVTYCAVQDGFAGEGNIDAYPGFVSAGDYHLSTDSPCVDAGDPAYVAEPGETDIDGERRVFAGRVDIGADEYMQLRPVADAGPDQTMASVPGLIALDGSGSYDPNGGALTFRWQQIEGAAVALSDCNAVGSTFVPPDFGIYAFELVVNNGVYDSLPDVVGIVIKVDNSAPIADGGSDRYAGEEPIVLDGSGCFDPDGYGIVRYLWRQISGPNAVIADGNTARPSITFPRRHYIQRCRFELVVSDEELDSEADSVDVTVVPAWGSEIERLYQLNPPFDPNKPTLVGFGGGYNCWHGGAWGSSGDWEDKANVITFDEYHTDYFGHYCDKLIVYLSKFAPDYREPIQTIGFSAGNSPAMAIARYLNLTYADPRYAVNRVTLIDEASRWCDHTIPEDIIRFVTNPVGGEQCWVENYIAVTAQLYSGVLNVRFPYVPEDLDYDEWWGVYHGIPRSWYGVSLDANSWVDGDIYNGGVTAGAYLSVIGPGKNLQVATEHVDKYYFEWSGEGPNDVWDDEPDSMLFFNEPCFPGRLPEPVVLVGPEDGAFVDSGGAVLNCEESENAVGYELWLGLDRYDMLFLVSDTPGPPNDVISTFPSETMWWTIKARDAYSSTIYADPMCIKAERVVPQGIKNTRKRKSYSSIQRAINNASDGDEIVIMPGLYQYRENINLKGRNITVRSTDPEEPAVVAATVINGSGKGSVVTFAGGEDANCVLAGLTITGGGNGDGEAGVLCLGRGTTPTITNCVITRNGGTGIYCGDQESPSSPTISNCLIAGNEGAGIKKMGKQAATVTNCTIVENGAGGVDRNRGIATITNCAIWGNNGDAIYGGSKGVRYCNIEGGLEGEGNIDADPCFVEPGFWADTNDPNIIVEPNDPNAIWVEGDYHLLEDSPCIDTGDPNYVGGPNETDLDGKARVIDGDEDGFSVIDMGAYEYTPPIPAEINIKPKTLNLASKGKWIMCIIRLAEDYNVADIDPNSILLEDEIPAERVWLLRRFAVAKFSRRAVREVLGEVETPSQVELVVSGELSDGTIFEGTDTIRVIDKGKRRNNLPGRAGRRVILKRKSTKGL